MELKQIGERTYYVSGMFHVGVYVLDKEDGPDIYADKIPVCLIDSGLDDEVAAEIDKLLCDNNFYVRMIINTHYHADHSGGNSYFKEKYDCVVLATKPNAALIANYDVCPAMLWGASPVQDILTHYFYTTSTEAIAIEDYELPGGLSTEAFPGHCIAMIGVRTSDDVLFVGDAVISEQTLSHSSLSYIYDIGEYLESLDRLERMSASVFVPYHAEPVNDISGLVCINRSSVMNIIAIIKDICEKPTSFEEIYSTIYNRCGMRTNLYRYTIEGAIVRGYLSYLYNNGELETLVIDNFIKWHTL